MPLPARADAGAWRAHVRGEPDSRFRLIPRILRRLGFFDHRVAAAAGLFAHVPAPEAVNWARWCEPQAQGNQRCDVPAVPARRADHSAADSPALIPAPASSLRLSAAGEVRQGLLGDCWFAAVLAACELSCPGFIASRIRRLPNGLVEVLLHTRLFRCDTARWVVTTPFVPAARRLGGAGGEATAASLVEKAAAMTFGRGSYAGLEHGFAGNALFLLTGRICPARPVPDLATLQRWLAAGRPVLASTLLRRSPARLIAREDDPQRSIAVMNGHVYVVCGISTVNEDGRPLNATEAAPAERNSAAREGGPAASEARLRVHVRNPLGGSDPPIGSPDPRRTDLYLSPAQFRRIFLSVNVGPPLSLPGQSAASPDSPERLGPAASPTERC